MWAAVRAELRRPGLSGGRGKRPPVDGATASRTGGLAGFAAFAFSGTGGGTAAVFTDTTDSGFFNGTFGIGLPVDLGSAGALPPDGVPELPFTAAMAFTAGFAAWDFLTAVFGTPSVCDPAFGTTLGVDPATFWAALLETALGEAFNGCLEAVFAGDFGAGLGGGTSGVALFLAEWTVLATVLTGVFGFLTGAFTICLL